MQAGGAVNISTRTVTLGAVTDGGAGNTLTTNGGITNVNGSFTGGTATMNANATTNFTASEELAALIIGPWATVTFSSGLPSFNADPTKAPLSTSSVSAVVPEPGSIGLLLARRRRTLR